MATIDSLAPELLGEIFGHLLHLPLLRDELRYRDLCSTSLVCRRWREPAQRVLFQTVALRSQTEADSWLQSPARTRYRTRGLEVDSENAWCDEVLEACPGLSSLTLGASRSGGHELCVLEGLDHDGLERLSISHPEFFPINPAALEFPNLRHLEVWLDGGDFHVLHPATLKSILLPSRHALTSLRLVSLGSETIAAQLIEILSEEPFQHVRHLALKDTATHERLHEVLSSFPFLTTLELDEDYDFDVVKSIGGRPLPSVQNLVLAGVGRASDDNFSELTRIIKLPNLGSLRRLEIPATSKDDLAGEVGLALLDECEKRSISLLCQYGYLSRDMMGAAPSAGQI